MKTTEQILTNDLRNNLKSIMLKEIAELPKQLKKLEPKERLDILIKIMPFVFPKINNVNTTKGEPFKIDFS